MLVGLHSICVRGVSGTHRPWFWNASSDSTQFGVTSGLILSWIGVRLAEKCTIPELRPTYHVPSLHGRRPNTSWQNLHPVFQTCLKDLSKQILLPDHITTPSRQKHINTDCKPTSLYLSALGNFCRFEFDFVLVWPVWLVCQHYQINSISLVTLQLLSIWFLPIHEEQPCRVRLRYIIRVWLFL